MKMGKTSFLLCLQTEVSQTSHWTTRHTSHAAPSGQLVDIPSCAYLAKEKLRAQLFFRKDLQGASAPHASHARHVTRRKVFPPPQPSSPPSPSATTPVWLCRSCRRRTRVRVFALSVCMPRDSRFAVYSALHHLKIKKEAPAAPAENANANENASAKRARQPLGALYNSL